MKIVNIIGGLGNQMFQYAFALRLQYEFPNEEVLIDTSHFNYIFINKIGPANLHNGYEIDRIFPRAVLQKANACQLRKVTRYMPNYFISRLIRRAFPIKKTEYVQNKHDIFAFSNEPLDIHGDCYYEGVWESISFISPILDQILEVYSHPVPDLINAKYINELESTDSVGIHVRRGDYLSLPDFQGICDEMYYKKAIGHILSDGKKHVFYIFTNDMEWCEMHLSPYIGDNILVFLRENTGDRSCWDMFLMSHCKDLIIANSSFSWWGAVLNKRKGTVIAPSKWTNREGDYDIWCKEWICI